MIELISQDEIDDLLDIVEESKIQDEIDDLLDIVEESKIQDEIDDLLDIEEESKIQDEIDDLLDIEEESKIQDEIDDLLDIEEESKINFSHKEFNNLLDSSLNIISRESLDKMKNIHTDVNFLVIKGKVQEIYKMKFSEEIDIVLKEMNLETPFQFIRKLFRVGCEIIELPMGVGIKIKRSSTRIFGGICVFKYNEKREELEYQLRKL